MPERAASVPYQPYSDISPHLAVPETRTDSDYLNVHATPQTEVGEAMQKGGAILEGVGDKAAQLAIQRQGLINETLATNAETQLIKNNAAAKSQFMATEGLETSAALPSYLATLQKNHEDLRAQLPAGALRQYDMLGTRQLANYTSDATSYEAGQVKKANMLSHSSLINAAEMAPLDPDVANNPTRVGEQLGTVAFAHGAMLDENSQGLVKDENGNIKFDESAPQGQAAKANLEASIDHSKGIIWQNTITTLANQDPLKAQAVFESNKEAIPPMAQARIDAFLTPKVETYKAGGVVNSALSQAQRDHQETFLNPQSSVASSAGSNPNNLGNVKTAAGASTGTQQFINPATPVDGVIATANNLRTNYQGLTLEQIAAKWTGESPEKVSDWVKNTSTASGIAANAVPNLNDPAQLSSLLKGIATAEKSPQDRARFNDQTISQGVQSSLEGKQATLLPSGQKKPYATNADGSPISLPDYYASNRDKILAQGDAMADRDFPGNPTYKTMVRERLTNQMNAAISSQTAQYKQDNQYVMKAINGDLTQGKTPMTYQELRQIPGVDKVLDRVAVQDPRFSESIDTLISRVARRADNQNSPNGYETILRTTQPNDPVTYPNRIESQDHLDRLLGRSDGTGISMKDYNDAKQLVDSSQQWKDFVATHMKQIANANGNVDGQGQQRALEWYNQVSQQKKANESKGENAVPEDRFIKDFTGSTNVHKPSSMDQITNWAKGLLTGSTQQPSVPTATGANGEKYILQDGQWVKQ